MGLGGRGVSKSVDIATLDRIDASLSGLQLEQGDFCELRIEDERIVSASSVKASFDKFSRAEMGPHRLTLAMEDIKDKIEQRILRLSKDEDVQERVLGLSYEEQIRLFGQQIAPLDDEEVISYTRRWLRMRYEPVLDSVDDAAWLRIDRIGRRMLDVETLDSVTWLYLKLALIGGGERHARYVMVDEVQDYTITQLAVLERFFPHAHFLLLGDENQAVSSGTASFEDIRALFERK
jgi:DNA helicase-2/ATP-dependent DNA helicase PcrA